MVPCTRGIYKLYIIILPCALQVLSTHHVVINYIHAPLRKLHVVKSWHSNELQRTIILVKFNTGHHCTATNDCTTWTHCSRASKPTIKNPHLEVTHTKVIIFIIHHDRTMEERVAKVETRKQCVNCSQWTW